MNVKEAAKRLPDFEQYRRNPSPAVSYIFMILFFFHFLYKEFIGKEDCGDKIAAFEKVILQKDAIIENLNKRVTKLENSVDVYNGVNQRIESTTEQLRSGGSK